LKGYGSGTLNFSDKTRTNSGARSSWDAPSSLNTTESSIRDSWSRNEQKKETKERMLFCGRSSTHQLIDNCQHRRYHLNEGGPISANKNGHHYSQQPPQLKPHVRLRHLNTSDRNICYKEIRRLGSDHESDMKQPPLCKGDKIRQYVGSTLREVDFGEANQHAGEDGGDKKEKCSARGIHNYRSPPETASNRMSFSLMNLLPHMWRMLWQQPSHQNLGDSNHPTACCF